MTLREAIAYLARTVPKAEQAVPEVLAAAEALTHAAERGIAWMFLARIATLRAIHRNIGAAEPAAPGGIVPWAVVASR